MKKVLRIVLLVFVGLTVAAGLAWWLMVSTPGSNYVDDMPDLDENQHAAAERLQEDVRTLATEIGPRHVGAPDGLQQSVEFIEERLESLGYEPSRISFETRGVPCHNVEVEIEGAERSDEVVIFGAHYDSAGDIPAANDNGSGVAANLELAGRFANADPARTLRFVFFVNEEPPWYRTENMGSLVYARRARGRGENIVAMVSLETVGYYDDSPDSQSYPVGALKWFYPDRGNFIGFVGNLGSRGTLRTAVEAFRRNAEIPSEGASLPGFVPGVGWSDHWSFWENDYPGIMVTDTALFRYPHYHTRRDTPEKLDYPRMALLVDGLETVVEAFVNPDD